MTYKYDLHLHTNVSSKCGKQSPQEVVNLYTKMGYDGIFVTDHFVNGNTRVDLTLPWAEQMEQYAQAYYQVKDASIGTKLKVFFGVEFTYCATDFLVFGLMPDWYKQHPEIITLPIKECLQLFRDSGACVIQAHPYREAPYIKYFRLFPRDVDGVETFNACNKPAENKLANFYANSYNLPKVCGSDIHITKYPQKLACFTTKKPINDEKDLLTILHQGCYKIRKQTNPLYQE